MWLMTYNTSDSYISECTFYKQEHFPHSHNTIIKMKKLILTLLLSHLQTPFGFCHLYQKDSIQNPALHLVFVPLYSEFLCLLLTFVNYHVTFDKMSFKFFWYFQDFLCSLVVRTLLPLRGARVQSLVRELRSHMLHDETTTQNSVISLWLDCMPLAGISEKCAVFFSLYIRWWQFQFVPLLMMFIMITWLQ